MTVDPTCTRLPSCWSLGNGLKYTTSPLHAITFCQRMRLTSDAKIVTLLLDFKTLSVTIFISSFLYAITVAFFALQANQYKGISLYMWGAICAALGFLARPLIIAFPNVATLRFAGGSFLILACYFYCLAIARLLNFNFNVRWLLQLF